MEPARGKCMRIVSWAFWSWVAAMAMFAGDALAASSDCGRGPPAWWNAPRVSYTYSGSAYASGHTRSFSAQKRAYQEPRRARMSYTPSR